MAPRPARQALTSAARTAWSRRLSRAAQSLRDLLEMRARERGRSAPQAEGWDAPPSRPPRAHLHQALREEAAVAPQLPAQPAPRGALAHLPDHVPRRQAQLTLLLRAVPGQHQHLCGRKRGSGGPRQGAPGPGASPGPALGRAGGGGGVCCHFHTVV